MEELGGQDILQLSLHDFYRPLTEGERVLADQGNFNFDLPGRPFFSFFFF